MSREAMNLALAFVKDIQRGKYKGDAEEVIAALQSAMTEQPAPVQGWKLVPVEPTREIEDAIAKARTLKASEIWGDAIAAAPQPAPVQQEPVAGLLGNDQCDKLVERVMSKLASKHNPVMSGEDLNPNIMTHHALRHSIVQAAFMAGAVSVAPQPAQQQEPVAWMYPDDHKRMLTNETFCTVYSVEVGSATRGESTVPLYTSTPAQRKPLTDEQIDQMWSDAHNDTSALSLVKVFARAIEAAHGIKENT